MIKTLALVWFGSSLPNTGKYYKVLKHNVRGNPARGFTLIELVIMVVIIGTLSAVLVLNFNSQNMHSVTVQADELRRDLSHLQLLAISGQGRLQLTVTANSYAICAATVTTCNAASAIIDTSTGASFSTTLTDGATFTSGSGNYYFDSLGRPVTNATSGALLPSTSSFQLNGVSRDKPVTVTVLPITGFAKTVY